MAEPPPGADANSSEMFFYRDFPPGNTMKPRNNHWVSKYPEDSLEANYHLWEMNVPINPNTGFPSIIGWQEAYPAGSLSHLSAYEEKLIRLLTGNCTREEAYAFRRKGNYMFDIVSNRRCNILSYSRPSQFLSHILRHGTLVHDAEGRSQYPPEDTPPEPLARGTVRHLH